jgi:hypothetical protein
LIVKTFADINLHPSASDMRGLRWTLLVGGAAMGAAFALVLHRPATAAAWGSATALLLLLSLVPRMGRYVYVAWLGLGVALGKVTTPLLLGVVWLVLFVPLALVFRLVGRDALRRRPLAAGMSYWVAHEKPTTVRNYFRQF